MFPPQVSLIFNLEASAAVHCGYGELVFMERYKEVLVELERVETKMESQSMSSSSSSSEGLGAAAASGAGRIRLGSSGRSTLQAIGSAAAAGSVRLIEVLFYFKATRCSFSTLKCYFYSYHLLYVHLHFMFIFVLAGGFWAGNQSFVIVYQASQGRRVSFRCAILPVTS